MRHAFIVALAGIMLVGVGIGCDSMKKKDSETKSGDMKMTTAKDDCPMCDGVQKANADGKCPACGMKVKS